MHAIRVALAATALAATANVALAQAPTMYTRWKDMSLAQQACVAKARAAVSAAGLAIVTVTELSVFANRGRCAVAVRCVAEKNLAFFAAASGDMDECQRFADGAWDRF